MKKSKHVLYVQWQPTAVQPPNEWNEVDAIGVLALGAVEVDEEEPLFTDFKVKIGAMQEGDKVVLHRDSFLHLLDHQEEKQSIVGPKKVLAVDREIHEIALYALAESSLKDSIYTTIDVEISQQCCDGGRSLATMFFEGHEENCSAFFAVWLITRGYSEYGYSYPTGKTDYSPASYMEEVCDILLRQFYPSIDF